MVLVYYTFAVLLGWGVISHTYGFVMQSLGVFGFNLVMDFYTLNFMMLLLTISTQVLLWSYYYMDNELHFRRFLSLLMLFLCSMFVLVFFSSLYGALIGWDGLGVTSFLLVIYFKNRKALGSGTLTAVTNRLGDCFLLACVAAHFTGLGGSYLATMCLLLTSMTKSAQFPFSAWLPAAMAAPTPVSALVHSSTLVTAGIYLLIRFNSLGTEWLLVVGSVTMFMAGLCACAEMDLKKVVALSTLSQLGVMVVALAIKLKDLCFFHLMTHAMFKALLFMSVGMGIHSVYGSQDFRSFSGFGAVSPLPSLFLSIANMSLAGLPFLSGFYSKDAILEAFYNIDTSFVFMLVFLVGVGLTTAYSYKIMSLALVGNKGVCSASLCGGGSGWATKLPLAILGIGSVCAGFVLGCSMSTLSPVMSSMDKLMPLTFIFLGVCVGFALSRFKYMFFAQMWYLTPSAQKMAGYTPMMGLSSELDRGILAMSLQSGGSLLVFYMFSVSRWTVLLALGLVCVLF